MFGLPAAHEDDGLRALRTPIGAAGRRSIRVRAAGRGRDRGGARRRGDVSSPAGRCTVARRVKEGAGPGGDPAGACRASAVGARGVDRAVGEGRARLVELVEGAPAIARRPDAPLVGRRAELERLVLAVARSPRRARRCRRVVVLGEPGIGKTRLAAELSRTLADETRVLTGRCVPYARGRHLPAARRDRRADRGRRGDRRGARRAARRSPTASRRRPAGAGALGHDRGGQR